MTNRIDQHWLAKQLGAEPNPIPLEEAVERGLVPPSPCHVVTAPPTAGVPLPEQHIKGHDDECPDCRPVILTKDDAGHLVSLHAEHPIMQCVNKFWYNETTYEERNAFHLFTCKNSREPAVMKIVAGLNKKMSAAIKEELG